MLALELEKSDVKDFMAKLLKTNFFDDFQLRSAEILTATRITIDGTPQDDAPFATYGATRPLICEIIKLCSKPRHIKIILAHAAPISIHQNAAALFLNLSYENDAVTFTTATAQKEFALDKSLDATWDEFIRKFFLGINVKDRE